ncbi:hypothetical protein BT69DRAFT_1240864 [Atractiella rhizophila]|nr:hypothetical protein BT69DRAFT_1240864 [Atractiella rhizophila]
MYSSYPMCLPCGERNRHVAQSDELDDESCYFENVRSFAHKGGKIESGPYWQTVTEDTIAPEYESLDHFSNSLSNATIQEVKTACAKALQSFLSSDLEAVSEMYKFATANKIAVIEKPQPLIERVTCDGCATTIVTGYWVCKLCGRSFCLDCKQRLLQEHGMIEKGKRKKPAKSRGKTVGERTELVVDSTFCRLQECLDKQTHDESTLLPFTSITMKDIHQLLEEVTNYLSSVNFLDAGFSALHLPPSIERVDPHPGEVEPYYLMRMETFSMQHFRQIWEMRPAPPVVVQGIEFGENWSMRELSDLYGDQDVDVMETQSGEEWEGHLRDVLEEMRKPERVKNMILRVKDWPKERFSEAEGLEEMYRELTEVLPAPEYTLEYGTLNILSYLPKNYLTPDIGARFDFALGSSLQEGTNGTSKLRVDAADEVNIMVYSLPVSGTRGTTVWDIFPIEETPKLRAYLRTIQAEENFCSISHAESNLDDPILSVQFYLDSTKLKILDEKYDIKRYRIYQQPGDAIFIPAGCPKQSCNLSNAANIFTNFIPPCTVSTVLDITRQMRQQTRDGTTLDDAVGGKSVCHWVYKACQHYEKLRTEQNM